MPTFADVFTALRHSHDRLVGAITKLTDDEVSRPSYCDDWTIAQVASHLGSGAQIFGLFVDAGLQRLPAPGADQFMPVWDRWNAKSAPEQAGDALIADAAFLNRLHVLTADERERWRLDLFGSEQTLTGLVRMRLGEHAVHTWDIVVALEPAATVAQDATELVIDHLRSLVERVGKPTPEPLSVRVTTSDPHRDLLLDLTTETAHMALHDDSAQAAAGLRLPAEAFVRLVYGRLDPSHTPAATATDGVDLDTLRRAFPGV